MRMRKMVFSTTLFVILFSLFTTAASANTDRQYASFTSPEGIHFESYSKEWNQDKLEELYKSFIKNIHGEELSLLSTIKLLPEEPEEGGDCSVAYKFDSNRHVTIPPGVTIRLYYADSLKNVKDMSFSLSHEYGHIFTYYWLAKKENTIPEMASNSQWAKIRDIKQYPVRWRYWEKENYNHFWEPEEIMADDYVQLFGSPDAKERLFWTPDMGNYDNTYIDQIENNVIDAPESVPGLRTFWEKLSGISTGKKELFEPHITSLNVDQTSQKTKYMITFTPVTKDPSDQIQYFIYWSTQSEHQIDHNFLSGYSPMQSNTNKIEIGVLPKEKLYLRVFALNPTTKQITYSPMYWYDFSDPINPKQIPNQFKND